MNNKITHPDWALQHRKPGTELKCINGRYYLYAVKSQYDKKTKRSKKISLGILGSITKDKGFVASDKKQLIEKSKKTYLNKEVFCLEYGFSKWLLNSLQEDGVLAKLKQIFPELWKFIIFG